MSDTYRDRLGQLRDLRDIIVDFEEEADEGTTEKLKQARWALEKAGDKVTDSNDYDRFYHMAAAQIAGIATGRGYDEYADSVYDVAPDLDPEETDD